MHKQSILAAFGRLTSETTSSFNFEKEKQMGINFGKGATKAAKVPTVADAIASDQAFQTSYGTIYHRAQGGEFIKFGNTKVGSRNFVAVKPATYFNGRENEAVTLLGDLNVTL